MLSIDCDGPAANQLNGFVRGEAFKGQAADHKEGTAAAMQPERPTQAQITGAKRPAVTLIPRTDAPKLNRMRILFINRSAVRGFAMAPVSASLSYAF